MTTNDELPYIITERIVIDRAYNPKYGDGRICECGHPYYRHFDTYENMYPCGCKYCPCFEFKEDDGTMKQFLFYKKNFKTRELSRHPIFVTQASNQEIAEDMFRKSPECDKLTEDEFFEINPDIELKFKDDGTDIR